MQEGIKAVEAGSLLKETPAVPDTLDTHNIFSFLDTNRGFHFKRHLGDLKVDKHQIPIALMGQYTEAAQKQRFRLADPELERMVRDTAFGNPYKVSHSLYIALYC
jgi:hypothetical protein